MSVPDILTNITLHQLNFTANCSNLPLGIQVWTNWDVGSSLGGYYYGLGNATSDNATLDDGPGGPNGEYPDWWTNGTALDWIAFWRSALESHVPTTNLSDKDVANWANTTESFYFFDYANLDVSEGTNLQFMSTFLADVQGCKASYRNITSIDEMEQACVLQYCCNPATNTSVTYNAHGTFPYYQNWTVEDACIFNTCQQENQGNPDLGGIGVSFTL